MTVSANLLGTLFEGAPALLDRVQPRPGETAEQLIDRAERVALDMPEAQQIELLNAHPRIGALPASVSALSYKEQGYDRDPGTAELQQRLDMLNDEYEEKFGFRFCVFVAGRPRSAIADIMESRMDFSREEELHRALSDVFDIARSRARLLASEAEEGK
jgi:2-oxo-4-hydroxy-4-carboxy--5-ureidoimidazoline (OHCU) decarboxylase